ncbi:MAG TPA: hypothetical protein VGW10_12480 [Solirubrobacteraceae bacterium]|nr:hypothetical protein [Solirubrobacteraceae bacterium]
MPSNVRSVAEGLSAACSRSRPRRSAVVEAHDAVHRALVDASGSPRIVARTAR